MTILRLAQTCFLTLVLILLAVPSSASATTCESLAALKLPDTTITWRSRLPLEHLSLRARTSRLLP